MTDKWKLIDRLGTELGASFSARQKWRQHGVPHKYRIDMIELAQREGVELGREDFDPVSEPRSAA